jgi:hypothetical protein
MLPLPLLLMFSIKLKLFVVELILEEDENNMAVETLSPSDATEHVRCGDVVVAIIGLLAMLLLFSLGLVEVLVRKNRRNILRQLVDG